MRGRRHVNEFYAEMNNWKRQARPLSDGEVAQAQRESPYTKTDVVKIKPSNWTWGNFLLVKQGQDKVRHVYHMKAEHSHPIYICEIPMDVDVYTNTALLELPEVKELLMQRRK